MVGVQCLWLVVVSVVVLFLGVVDPAKDVDGLNIWPMPMSVSKGHMRVYISQDFQLITEGTKYNDGSGILKDGFTRMLDVLKVAHVADGNLSSVDTSLILKGIHVLIFSPNDQVCNGCLYLPFSLSLD